jgi:hypothetical protein
MHNILKILECAILDHLGYQFCIILRDCVFGRGSMRLHILARTSRLSSWSLSRAWILWIRTWCSPLRCLDLFLLYLGSLCIILLPLLGYCLGCPSFCLLWFGLAFPWFLRHYDFLGLCLFLTCLLIMCMFLPCLLLLCPCRYVSSEDWNPPIVFPILDGHFYIPLCDAIVHL